MIFFSFLFVLLAISCEENTQVYRVVGTVYSVDLDTQNAIIAHDTIPNLMMPMVMPFFIKDLKDAKNIQVGDSVHFELVWSCLLYTSPSPRDATLSRMPSSA